MFGSTKTTRTLGLPCSFPTVWSIKRETGEKNVCEV